MTYNKSTFLKRIVLFTVFVLCIDFLFAIDVKLIVKETLGISRVDEMVHNGIPISKDENIFTVDNLIIENSEGVQIPATFEVISRWGGGKDNTSCQIQWILVSFPASIDANTEKFYYLKEGTPVNINNPIVLTENPDSYTINTGVAEFVIDKNNMTLFNSISNSNYILATGNNGGSISIINGQTAANAKSPSFTIERNNNNYLCIKAEGDYANTPVGNESAKPLSYKIRYEFHAGSPTAIIYHKFFWSGSYSDFSYGAPITIDKVSLLLPEVKDYSSTAVYSDESNFHTGSLTESQTASIRQRLRTIFADPHLAEINLASASTTTEFTSRPMLINYNNNGGIAVSIDHMKYFEPQAINTDGTGAITIDVMAENQYFACNQGTWARVGITALNTDETYNDALQKNFAPLNNRLFAFPSKEYVARSRVFAELPGNYTSSPISQKHFDNLKDITSSTKYWLDTLERYQGLMTWGSLTRYASINPNVGSETGAGTGWDKVYSGANHSDYQNTWQNTIFQFILEGEPDLLYDYSFNGARRMIHTQVVQPDWEVSSWRMGWGFSGHDNYRSDGNSCHSYFDNSYSYYYLTGDMEVIDILKTGAETKRSWYTRQDDGTLNKMTDPAEASWVNFNGRTFGQSSSSFNFIGHVADESFLDDFLHMYHHAFSSNVALFQNDDGIEYGFLVYNNDNTSPFATEQSWMQSLHFCHYLYLIYNEYGDIPMGEKNITISRVFKAFAHTYMEYFAKLSESGHTGDGTWSGTWCNELLIEYTGDHIGGNLISVTDDVNEPMYNSGKMAIITQILRAGAMNNDTEITNFGLQGLEWAINYEEMVECADRPWEKINGLMFIRLIHGMSYLSNEPLTLPENQEYGFELYQNFPNPYTSETRIEYSVPASMHVKIEVFNLSGQKIAELVNGNINAGVHVIDFGMNQLPKGTYLCKMEAMGLSIVKKMVHIK